MQSHTTHARTHAPAHNSQSIHRPNPHHARFACHQGTSMLVLKDSTVYGKLVVKHSTCEVPCLPHSPPPSEDLSRNASPVNGSSLSWLPVPTMRGHWLKLSSNCCPITSQSATKPLQHQTRCLEAAPSHPSCNPGAGKQPHHIPVGNSGPAIEVLRRWRQPRKLQGRWHASFMSMTVMQVPHSGAYDGHMGIRHSAYDSHAGVGHYAYVSHASFTL
jgi:hypothetical protein